MLDKEELDKRAIEQLLDGEAFLLLHTDQHFVLPSCFANAEVRRSSFVYPLDSIYIASKSGFKTHDFI